MAEIQNIEGLRELGWIFRTELSAAIDNAVRKLNKGIR